MRRVAAGGKEAHMAGGDMIGTVRDGDDDASELEDTFIHKR